MKTNTHIWHVGVYVGFRAEVGGPAVIHFQHWSDVAAMLHAVCVFKFCLRLLIMHRTRNTSDQTKKVPAFGPGRVIFEHIRAFLSPYHATTFEYVPNNVAKRQPRPPHEIVLRAFSFYQRGFGEYNCAVNNCEDFVLQCVYAMPPLLSDQTKVRITMSSHHNGCDFCPLACTMTNSMPLYRSARTYVSLVRSPVGVCRSCCRGCYRWSHSCQHGFAARGRSLE